MYRIVLSIILCMTLCICGGCGKEKKEESLLDLNSYEKTENGGIIISEEEFSSYITRTELTLENWNAYFELREGEDGVYGLYTKNHRNAVSQFEGRSARIQLKDMKTGETKSYQVSEGLVIQTEQSYTLADFECVSIEGVVLIVNVPEELWQNVKQEQLWEVSEDKIPTIYVGDSKAYTWFTQKFGVGNDLQEYFY